MLGGWGYPFDVARHLGQTWLGNRVITAHRGDPCKDHKDPGGAIRDRASLRLRLLLRVQGLGRPRQPGGKGLQHRRGRRRARCRRRRFQDQGQRATRRILLRSRRGLSATGCNGGPAHRLRPARLRRHRAAHGRAPKGRSGVGLPVDRHRSEGSVHASQRRAEADQNGAPEAGVVLLGVAPRGCSIPAGSQFEGDGAVDGRPRPGYPRNSQVLPQGSTCCLHHTPGSTTLRTRWR
jgi:hypothetical protein